MLHDIERFRRICASTQYTQIMSYYGKDFVAQGQSLMDNYVKDFMTYLHGQRFASVSYTLDFFESSAEFIPFITLKPIPMQTKPSWPSGA